MLLNAVKALAGIDENLHLISPMVIEPVQNLKVEYLGNAIQGCIRMRVLVALSICATTTKSRGGDAAAQEAPGL